VENFHKEILVHVFRLSITKVIFSASLYCSAISSMKIAQSRLLFLSVIVTIRFPASGSQAIKILQTPWRIYS